MVTTSRANRREQALALIEELRNKAGAIRRTWMLDHPRAKYLSEYIEGLAAGYEAVAKILCNTLVGHEWIEDTWEDVCQFCRESKPEEASNGNHE